MAVPGIIGRITLFALLFATSASSFGFPAPDVSFRQLIDNSDLIVLATVVPSEPPPKRENAPFEIVSVLGTSPAHLSPLSVLKGHVPPGLIAVHFNPGLVCPSPPRFRVGSNVLAFLRENTPTRPFASGPMTRELVATNGFHTVALSQGAKELSEPAARAYSEMIQEYLQISGARDQQPKLHKIVEWLVKCAENPHTRWEGAYELAGPFDQSTQKQINEFAPYLMQSQIARLSNVLFRAEFISAGEWALIRVFQDTAQPQVLGLLRDYIKKADRIWPPTNSVLTDDDSFPHPWNIYDAMVRVAELLNSKEAKTFVDQYKRTDFFAAQTRVAAASNFLAIINRGREKAP